MVQYIYIYIQIYIYLVMVQYTYIYIYIYVYIYIYIYAKFSFVETKAMNDFYVSISAPVAIYMHFTTLTYYPACGRF